MKLVTRGDKSWIEVFKLGPVPYIYGGDRALPSTTTTTTGPRAAPFVATDDAPLLDLFRRPSASPGLKHKASPGYEGGRKKKTEIPRKWLL